MINVKDIHELKRRLTKERCSIRKLYGCYMDFDEGLIMDFSDKFLSLPDELFYKYLDIADTVLSKRVNDKMLDLTVSNTEFTDKLDELIKVDMLPAEAREICEIIWENIDQEQFHGANMLILMYRDTYDIPIKGNDGMNQDDSEDVYDYIMCAICPVGIEAPGIVFNGTNFINKPRIEQVYEPVAGFIYPAFMDRTSSKEHIMYYSASAKAPDHWLMEKGFACKPEMSMTETRIKFEEIFKDIVGEEAAEDYLIDLNVIIENQIRHLEACRGTFEGLHYNMTQDDIVECLRAIKLPECYIPEVLNKFKSFNEPPRFDYIFNKTLYKKSEIKSDIDRLINLVREAIITIETNEGKETKLTQDIRNELAKRK